RSSSLSRRVCRSGIEDGVADGSLEDHGISQLPTDTTDPTQSVLQWILESKRQSRHKSHSSNQSAKKFGGSSTQTHTWGGGGSCGLLRNYQPAQPFIQDPAMPPLPPPNTLSQLEEACRRLEEVSTKPTKQRYRTDTRALAWYYFKKASDEFECGAVFEEVSDDSSLLPTYEGKILGKVERMD
ncbi:hypothetical protein GOODEAATRI_015538, partial [Goodea atripinnis]